MTVLRGQVGQVGRVRQVGLSQPPALPALPALPAHHTSTAFRTTRLRLQRLRRLSGLVSMISTMSPIFAAFSSSWTMNVDVRRSVLPYSPWRACHCTATTQLFCILSLTTTPVFSAFCDIFLILESGNWVIW